MKKRKKTKRKKVKTIPLVLLILFVIVIAAIGYYTFIYKKTCYTSSCFLSELESCDKATWIKEDVQSSWFYEIKGWTEDGCKVKVELIQLKKGSINNEILEGKYMYCYMPEGNKEYPEKQISRCHGLLKEEMQNLIIQKMHSYLLENLGEIEEEFKVV